MLPVTAQVKVTHNWWGTQRRDSLCLRRQLSFQTWAFILAQNKLSFTTAMSLVVIPNFHTRGAPGESALDRLVRVGY